MRLYLFGFIAIFLLGGSKQPENYVDYPISPVNVRDVVICDSFWLPKIKLIQDTTIPYAFKKCEQEGRMDNFLIAGGLKSGQKRGTMPFDDTDVYKIIEGASYSLISSPNRHLDAYIDSVIAIIGKGQEPDGYLTTWYSINPSKPGESWCKPSKKRWEHEDCNHELYNSGHLFEAAVAHYLATGKRNFLDIAIKNADLLVATFGNGKLQVPPGHQIVETGLIRLYHITHKKSYLELAKHFLDWRGDKSTHQLYGEYSQDFLPVTQQAEAVGHAVRAVYMYAGMTDIAAIYCDPSYRASLNKIWDNVVNCKTYITGGIGSRHEGEMFGGNYELPNLSAYNETCAAIGSIYWNQRMFQLTGDSKYIDVLERTLYNGMISGLSTDGKKFFYPNPLESDGKYKFNQGACTRSGWFDCSCCPTNLIRFIPSLPSLIYGLKADSLYVNLFVANNAKMKIAGQDVSVIQKTSYPSNGNITLVLNPANEAQFKVLVRIPGWTQNSVLPGTLYKYVETRKSDVKLLVNGKLEKVTSRGGYVCISRKWKKGDKIDIVLPFQVRKVITNDKVIDNRDRVAIEYGPIVYCAEEVDNLDFKSLSVSPKESFSVLNGEVNNTKAIILKGSKSQLTLIPYYLWSNRGIGKMKVWLSMKK